MEDSVFQESSPTFPAPRRRNQKRLALFIVVVLIVIIFSVFITISNTNRPKQSPSPTPTAAPIVTEGPTEELTPTEEITIEPEETNTPTPKPTANPVDKETGLDRSKLSIAVENGSGVAGAAGKVATLLKDLGYKIVSTGNADNFNYEKVVIRVKSQNSEYLSLLKADLGKEYTIGETSSDLSASVSAGALIIIGK